MRKIPNQYENFIDNILIRIVEMIQPQFYKMGFTPNILTTLSSICWLIGIYFFINDGMYYTFYTVLFFMVSYFFDCFDGHFARSYNMVTTFGDYYDHITDILKFIILLYCIYKLYKSKFYKVLLILGVFTVLSFMHLSCQELYVGTTSDTLSLLKYFCIANKHNVKRVLHITKYFGCGTLYPVTMLCVMYLKMNKK